jgi:hypothetical protein
MRGKTPRVDEESRDEKSQRKPSARRLRWRRIVVFTSGLLLLTAMSVVLIASRAPGTDPLAVKVAVWGRSHGLGFAITAYERVSYWVHPPKVGGTATISVSPAPTKSGTSHNYKPIPPVASGAPIAHEGVWQSVVTRDGSPVVQVAYVRPDSQHTSYLTAVMLMDHSRVRLQLHPGYEDPGKPTRFGVADRIRRADWPTLVAAFNSGFKLADARGGFYLNGVTAAPLREGAASLVTYKDGSMDVGAWGTDVTMRPDVTSVRQNLDLLVDKGQLTSSADAAVKSSWGATLGGTYFVWRTGIGVRKDGDIVFAVGDSLSARTLARVLHAAGAVRAMQLDINPDWAAGFWFSPPKSGAVSSRPVAHKVLAFKKPMYRWFTATSRDFYSVHLREPVRP